ncbi:signal peptidase I [Actinophytocola sp.]|uniref:signal peptidase I n=1 Tax=Actinophytocola sp. TaxID=1872138 RepID=UPI002D7FA27B|nr:signal peptidase I [Actinophytocola sp.]HET9138763.1 signal peptidase I [Actinophytocola sp.]
MRWWHVAPIPLLLLLSGCDSVQSAVTTRRYTVTAENMEPGLHAGQVVHARKVARGQYRASRGDIVVFIGPDSWGPTAGQTLITRVAAVGGEVIGCCDPAGQVAVDGAVLHEPYVATNAPLDGPADDCNGRRFGPVTVPADHIFVLGDNRTRSGDSRCAGTIATNTVIAVVTPA